MLLVNVLNQEITFELRFLTMFLVGLTQINYYAILNYRKFETTTAASFLNFMHSKKRPLCPINYN